MHKIVFILGGARSGKSTFALEEASRIKGRKAFIATAQAFDDEMRRRIEKHREERGKEWATLEEPLHVPELIRKITGSYDVIVIDCLTLWLSNIMHAEHGINEQIEDLIGALLQEHPSHVFIVSNEVGMGLVPETPLGREYRDNLGAVNRKVADIATDVYFLAAGIPLKIKETH